MTHTLRETAKQAVSTASQLCQQIQHKLKDGQTFTKDDLSPVTVADFASQAIVAIMLERQYPDIPIVAEEELEVLQDPSADALKKEVLRLVQMALPEVRDEDIFSAIGRCQHERPQTERYWTLDPIDGTKGFLRGGQYAISLALIEQEKVQMGILGAPNMATHPDGEGWGEGALFIAEQGKGVVSQGLTSTTEHKLEIQAASPRACEPMESKHTSRDVSDKVQAALGLQQPALQMDSQCKYAAVGTGLASLYLRLPSSKSYQEKVWDHAAGSLIVEEMGGRVTDVHGKSLPMGSSVLFPPNSGVIASLGIDHDKVVEAIRQCISQA